MGYTKNPFEAIYQILVSTCAGLDGDVPPQFLSKLDC